MMKDIQLRSGENLAVIGDNGAGKTIFGYSVLENIVTHLFFLRFLLLVLKKPGENIRTTRRRCAKRPRRALRLFRKRALRGLLWCPCIYILENSYLTDTGILILAPGLRLQDGDCNRIRHHRMRQLDSVRPLQRDGTLMKLESVQQPLLHHRSVSKVPPYSSRFSVYNI